MDVEQVKIIEKKLRLIMDKTYPLCDFTMEDVAVAARDCNKLAYEAFEVIRSKALESDSVLTSSEPAVFKPSDTDSIEGRKKMKQ